MKEAESPQPAVATCDRMAIVLNVPGTSEGGPCTRTSARKLSFDARALRVMTGGSKGVVTPEEVPVPDRDIDSTGARYVVLRI
ncbi:hypothetical protein HBH70_037450 [Parastagonospora nodorum]|nr:hypothetical protein HBH53_015050 [Parastagonospora nodorum]KAH3988137.1 hypothetical protein HBH51_002870 [Parastagonospora nodorum]KAH4040484.1 hypothetical protein HBI09_028560 [Parastagonospora nodorum]KAH4056209.1 hypothetical protein HBH49_050540 [Parastagonospora nodorum]KAH4071198.1 hypothetical protein HBH50_077720 [Parastagonospora nodorum]